MVPEELRAQLEELRKSYARRLPEKVRGVESCCEGFLQGAWDEAACAAAYRAVHSLAGSSGTYGFAELTPPARSLETLLKASLEGRAPLDPAAREQARGLLSLIREMAADAARKENP